MSPERLKQIRSRYSKTNVNINIPSVAPRTNNTSKGVLATLTRLLSPTKKAVTPPPVPKAENKKADVNKEKLIEIKLRRQLKAEQRERKKIETLYSQALEKGLAKEGTLEALDLKNSIKANFNEASNIISNYNAEGTEIRKTKKQNINKSIEDLHRKQLQRSGVQYANPQLNNNTL
jgi:hypothetical protein